MFAEVPVARVFGPRAWIKCIYNLGLIEEHKRRTVLSWILDQSQIVDALGPSPRSFQTTLPATPTLTVECDSEEVSTRVEFY